MSDCVVKSGESIDPSDPRLSDTACMIETGVIIRPPPDLTVAVEPPKPVQKSHPERHSPAVYVAPVVSSKEQAPDPVVKQEAKVAVKPVTDSHTVVNEKVISPPVEDTGAMNPTTVAIAAGAAVVVAGTAAAGASVGGFSALQAKMASLFGSSKATAVAAVTVTAGTIVAVKALETKMNKLEKDLEKTKEEVGSAASSIDRIDALLGKLGN